MSYLRRPLFALTLTTSVAWGFLSACGATSTDTGSDSDQTGGTAGGDDITLDGSGGSDSNIDPGDLNNAPPPVTCGDGVLNEGEACDDGNLDSGDGCLKNCLVLEPGYTCPEPGQPCFPYARCGDGIVSFPEQCDGGTAGVTGCTDKCKVALGYKCMASDGVSTCSETVCGDGNIEGTETCDDGPAQDPPLPFDGCDEQCQAEPNCGPNGCTSSCGDGIVLGEDCDDGNKTSGDGCSVTCKVEEGYVCKQAPCEEINGTCVLKIPAVFRDFTTGSDFQAWDCNGQIDNITKPLLDSKGKPVLADAPPSGICIASATSFSGWYRDTDISHTLVGSITLFANGANGYVNEYGVLGNGLTSARYNNVDGNPLFFPMDVYPEYSLADDPLATSAKIPQEVYGGDWKDEPGQPKHNFGFSSEVTYWFQYDASQSPVLSFTGDDDVWVFINRKLAVDLGGLHVPLTDSVTINTAAATKFGLVDGKVYEIKVFHAERKPTGSSFKLTLSGFDSSRSDCEAKCGDGIIGGNEECDDGVNDGGYNECQPGCVLGGYCGDGKLQEGEDCDDGDPNAPDGCSGCHVIIIK